MNDERFHRLVFVHRPGGRPRTFNVSAHPNICQSNTERTCMDDIVVVARFRLGPGTRVRRESEARLLGSNRERTGLSTASRDPEQRC